jgi:signal peptidase I
MSLKRIVFGASPGRTLVRGLTLALLLLVGSKTVAIPIRATGISMLPTFGDGQLLFFNAIAYRWAAPARGDVVVITMEARDVVLVKRIIALPGERVRIVDGQVLVDDVPLAEPYLRHRSAWNVDEVVLTPDEYFVIGDNRAMAPRNHTFGAVSRDRLYARLLF